MINRLFLLYIFFLLTMHWGKGEIISLTGVYEGLNLYVENDLHQGKSCIKEIFVNDLHIEMDKDNPFFEIDMSFLKLKEKVTVKIICDQGCKAKILNPEAIDIMYGFRFTSLNLEKGKIEWVTINEKAGGKYIVEIQLHKRWSILGEIEGKPGTLANFYDIEIETLKNVFYRVKYIDKEGIAVYSEPFKY